MLATETTLLLSAISTGVASFGKKTDATRAHANFQKMIKDLDDG